MNTAVLLKLLSNPIFYKIYFPTPSTKHLDFKKFKQDTLLKSEEVTFEKIIRFENRIFVITNNRLLIFSAELKPLKSITLKSTGLKSYFVVKDTVFLVLDCIYSFHSLTQEIQK